MQIIDSGILYCSPFDAPQEFCCAYTSLLRLSDGTLLCSFKSGPRKLSPQDGMVLMQSVDEGRSWNRLFDGFSKFFGQTPGSYSGGYLCEHTPGKLLISLHWIDRSDPDLPLSNPVTSGVLPMKYLISSSDNAGKTWSPCKEVSLSPHSGSNPTGEIIRLKNGRLLLSYESWKEWDAVVGHQSANVKTSCDDGETWSSPATLAHDPDGRFYFWDNRLAKHPDTGRLLAACWTHDAVRGIDAPIHLVWGEPNGESWSTPVSTEIQGQVAVPLFLNDGQLMLIYVHRHDPPSIRAALSEDMGRTWQIENETILYKCEETTQAGMNRPRNEADYWNDMTRWTFGHPKAVSLGDGNILVVYYAPSKSQANCSSNNAKNSPQSPSLSIHWTCLGHSRIRGSHYGTSESSHLLAGSIN